MAKTRSAFLQDLAWRLEALGFDLLTVALRTLPVDVASALGAALFKALGPLSRAHKTADLNLRLAFPDMADPERRRLLAAQWDNFGRYTTEFSLLDKLTLASGRVEVVNGERLAEIAASGRPVAFISGHFSNLEIMAVVIVGMGVECDVTYRAANNPYVDARIKKSRFGYGVRMFAPKGGEGARALLVAMAQGRSVAMLNDQKYDGGVAGPFFGRTVYTNPAAVRLALKFGCVVQPMSIQRRRGARFRCIVHAPIVVEDTGDRARDIEAGVAAVNAFIEARVRERPGEWWWMHRRWPAQAYAELVALEA
jgi:Kdo2-lipid IVA lauroyltransferase/acyltransferase